MKFILPLTIFGFVSLSVYAESSNTSPPITPDECIKTIMNSSNTPANKVLLAEECSKIVVPTKENVETVVKQVTESVPKVAEQAENVMQVAPKMLKQASEISVTIAETVKLVAKELNVAVNEFIQTPVGMVVAGMTILHFTGDYAKSFLNFVWDVCVGVIIMIISIVFGSAMRKKLLTGEPKEITVTNFLGKPVQKYVKTTLNFENLKLADIKDDEINNIYAGVVISYAIQIIGCVVGVCFMV